MEINQHAKEKGRTRSSRQEKGVKDSFPQDKTWGIATGWKGRETRIRRGCEKKQGTLIWSTFCTGLREVRHQKRENECQGDRKSQRVAQKYAAQKYAHLKYPLAQAKRSEATNEKEEKKERKSNRRMLTPVFDCSAHLTCTGQIRAMIKSKG